MADYFCWPLWVSTGESLAVNTDPSDLPISPHLASDLVSWAQAFDQILNQEYPPDSAFADAATETAFYRTGMLLACRLAIELNGQHEIVYFDPRREEPDRNLPILAGGRVKVLDGILHLPDYWCDVSTDPGQRHPLEARLRLEVSRKHVLKGKQTVVLARCGRCDDILVHLPDQRAYAIVHLTWSRSREADPQWPRTDIHTDPAKLLADLTSRH
ncbi:MAG TPA: hypothetical protein DGG94_08380 [Micromonosporaceae bacterium]|nr:hypothetical protein [Micromonosporaceae bacterium]HCU49800.1 hypothetical protein [Micromonosporaceae bacterium]